MKNRKNEDFSEEGNDFQVIEDKPKTDAKTGSKSGNDNVQQTDEQQNYRIRMPRGKEKVGRVVSRLGGNRMEVICQDGKTRNCRVPGRFRRNFWLRPGDYVIIQVWEYDDDKGDIIFQYRKGSEPKLRRAGLLENMTDKLF